MDFSPYRPSPDDDRRKQHERQSKGKSRSSKSNSSNRYEPVSTNPTTAGIPGGGFSSYQAGTDNPSLYEQGFGGESSGLQSNATVRVNKYETRLPIRVDIEAALTYILGPITGILFLILETKNDYVRFHAWQSSALFLSLMCVHFVLMFISSVLSWMLFAIDILLILALVYRAYLDGASLERTMVPYFGPLAAEWVDSE
ncbi:hypothetical protein BATDEDRAFT_89137 [Lichtheimia corymbifera JMRC:FSU:9682]|uniref:Uncharacterized protein n=1 Tax=Lichtheimia corymbifera JMRC:FSU:9682 TaxID=1263082 RepID=A0A068RVH2_9FUNG|nr:hypothetical protein BATDEDRAFT_89137 [Lichtheimia corymbifera JMRC:FSU:9682]